MTGESGRESMYVHAYGERSEQQEPNQPNAAAAVSGNQGATNNNTKQSTPTRPVSQQYSSPYAGNAVANSPHVPPNYYPPYHAAYPNQPQPSAGPPKSNPGTPSKTSPQSKSNGTPSSLASPPRIHHGYPPHAGPEQHPPLPQQPPSHVPGQQPPPHPQAHPHTLPSNPYWPVPHPQYAPPLQPQTYHPPSYGAPEHVHSHSAPPPYPYWSRPAYYYPPTMPNGMPVQHPHVQHNPHQPHSSGMQPPPHPQQLPPPPTSAAGQANGKGKKAKKASLAVSKRKSPPRVGTRPRDPENEASPNVKVEESPGRGTLHAAEESQSTSKSPSEIELDHRDDVQTMGCTCKKTNCLKLYCQCFAAKLYCGTICRCYNCQNTPRFEKKREHAIRSIMVRNPSAFDAKFRKDDRESATHRIGCKCRKSACLKKYCECFAGNVLCSASCRCVGCKNTGDGTPADSPKKSQNHRPPAPSFPSGQQPTTAAVPPVPAAYHAPPPHMVHGMAPMQPYYPQHPPASYASPHVPHPYHQHMQQPGMPPMPVAQPPAPPGAQPYGGLEPWDAAQSLTFLKRSGPPEPGQTDGADALPATAPAPPQASLQLPPPHPSGGPQPPMAAPGSSQRPPLPPANHPALGVSPITKPPPGQQMPPGTDGHGKNNRPGGQEDKSALMLAAQAMTEFGQSPTPPSGPTATESGDRIGGAGTKRNIDFDTDDDADPKRHQTAAV